MARTTVQMPSESAILSMETLPLQALAVECEINPYGAAVVIQRNGQPINTYPNAIPQQILQGYLLTIRALFDGRQFSILRSNLTALVPLVIPNYVYDDDTDTGAIALALAKAFSAQQP